MHCTCIINTLRKFVGKIVDSSLDWPSLCVNFALQMCGLFCLTFQAGVYLFGFVHFFLFPRSKICISSTISAAFLPPLVPTDSNLELYMFSFSPGGMKMTWCAPARVQSEYIICPCNMIVIYGLQSGCQIKDRQFVGLLPTCPPASPTQLILQPLNFHIYMAEGGGVVVVGVGCCHQQQQASVCQAQS